MSNLIEDRENALWDKAPEWDGKYPICLDDRFFMEEEELLTFLDDFSVDEVPTALRHMYACSEIHARDTIKARWLVEQVEESMAFEDAECPDEIRALIDDFIAKLEKIKDPIAWIGDVRVKATQEQIEYLSREQWSRGLRKLRL